MISIEALYTHLIGTLILPSQDNKTIQQMHYSMKELNILKLFNSSQE